MTVTTVTMTAQPHWLHSHQQFEVITLFRLLASPQTLVLGKQVPEFGLPQLVFSLTLKNWSFSSNVGILQQQQLFQFNSILFI